MAPRDTQGVAGVIAISIGTVNVEGVFGTEGIVFGVLFPSLHATIGLEGDTATLGSAFNDVPFCVLFLSSKKFAMLALEEIAKETGERGFRTDFDSTFLALAATEEQLLFTLLPGISEFLLPIKYNDEAHKMRPKMSNEVRHSHILFSMISFLFNDSINQKYIL